MHPLVFVKRYGIRRNGRSGYISLHGDARFTYWFWSKRPRYLIIFLDNLGDGLDPRLYVDHGNGFDERSSIELTQAGPSVYIISVDEPRCVQFLRFDPCTFEERFIYRAWFAWTNEDRDRLVKKATSIGGARSNIYNIRLSGHAEKRLRNRRNWIAEHYAAVTALAERTERDASAPTRHILSIAFVVPVYNTPSHYLDDLLASFIAQNNDTAELIFSDDGSTSQATLSWLERHRRVSQIKVIRAEENNGIAFATNAAVASTEAEWIGLLDHDDALSPATVFLISQTVNDNPNCKFIYTDEVITDDKLRPVSIHLKPAFDPVLLSGVNYINHLSCFRRERFLAIGGMRQGYEGSQDYDLLLRYLRDLPADQIKHLPYPAYLWRRNKKSFSARFLELSTAHARKALSERYAVAGKSAVVEEALSPALHRVRFDKQLRNWPKVTIVIPNRNSFALISRVLDDVLTRTDYSNLEIIVVDNGTTDQNVLRLYARIGESNSHFRCMFQEGVFNFSRLVNLGISQATGDYVLLLNNDVETLDDAWLHELVSCFSYSDTGIAGARLLYPNKRIQHAGVIIGLGGLAGHWFLGQPTRQQGPMGRLHVRQSLTAVTGACMLISRRCLDAVGCFDEEQFAVAYNDVDFSLRAVEKGFRIVWTPFATLVHYESASRGSDTTQANRVRFEREKSNLRSRHLTENFIDRAFNPWYTRDRSDPQPIVLSSVPKAR